MMSCQEKSLALFFGQLIFRALVGFATTLNGLTLFSEVKVKSRFGFGIDRYSTVSSVVERMKALVKKYEELRARVGHLPSIITRSQEPTRPLRPQKGKRAKEFAKNLKIQYISVIRDVIRDVGSQATCRIRC